MDYGDDWGPEQVDCEGCGTAIRADTPALYLCEDCLAERAITDAEWSDERKRIYQRVVAKHLGSGYRSIN